MREARLVFAGIASLLGGLLLVTASCSQVCECPLDVAPLTVTVVDARSGTLIADPVFSSGSGAGSVALDAQCTADARSAGCPSWTIALPVLETGAIPAAEQTISVSAPGYAAQEVSFAFHRNSFACGCVGVDSIDKTVMLEPAS